MATDPQFRCLRLGPIQLPFALTPLIVAVIIKRYVDLRNSAIGDFAYIFCLIFGVSWLVGEGIGNWRAGIVVGIVFGLGIGALGAFLDVVGRGL